MTTNVSQINDNPTFWSAAHSSSESSVDPAGHM